MKLQFIFFKDQIKQFKISKIKFSKPANFEKTTVESLVLKANTANSNGDVFIIDRDIQFHDIGVVADPAPNCSLEVAPMVQEENKYKISKYLKIFFKEEVMRSERLLANVKVKKFFYVNIKDMAAANLGVEAITDSIKATMREGTTGIIGTTARSIGIDISAGVSYSSHYAISMSGNVGIGSTPMGIINVTS